MKKHYATLLSILFISLSFQALAYPPAEKDEVTIDKLDSAIRDLEGKVVEVEFSYAKRIQQQDDGTYSVSCGRWIDNNGYAQSYEETVYFSGEEAKEHFADLSEKTDDPWAGSCSESIYVLVENGKLTAIGTRFKKSKGSYKW